MKDFDSRLVPLLKSSVPSRNSRNIPALNKNDAISGYFDLKRKNSTVLMEIISINILNTGFKIFNRFNFLIFESNSNQNLKIRRIIRNLRELREFCGNALSLRDSRPVPHSEFLVPLPPVPAGFPFGALADIF